MSTRQEFFKRIVMEYIKFARKTLFIISSDNSSKLKFSGVIIFGDPYASFTEELPRYHHQNGTTTITQYLKDEANASKLELNCFCAFQQSISVGRMVTIAWWYRIQYPDNTFLIADYQGHWHHLLLTRRMEKLTAPLADFGNKSSRGFVNYISGHKIMVGSV